MNAALLAGATTCLVAAHLLYFHRGFAAAGLLCAGYLACAVPLALAVLDPVSAALVLATFGALPAAALAVHAFDARTGRFLLPTIYAIPLASFLLVALWLVCVLAFFH